MNDTHVVVPGGDDLKIEKDAVAASQGDMDALGLLHDRYAHQLHRWIMSKCRGNLALSDDLSSETWVKVAISIKSYRPPSEGGGMFVGWLYAIARNTIVDHYRSRSTRTEHLYSPLIVTQLDEFNEDLAPHTSLDMYAVADEARQAIAAAVERLPKAQRQVMILHYWDRLSLAETAAVLGRTVNSVKALNQRGLRKLQVTLDTYAPRNFDASVLVDASGATAAMSRPVA